MSGGGLEGEAVHNAVPLADLSAVEAALREGAEALKAAVRKVRPADVGRELSRLAIDDGRRILEAADDRRASAMLRSAHPAVGARVIASCDPAHAGRVLGFLPIDVQASILGGLSPEERKRLDDKLAPEDRKLVDRVLSYRPSSVARLMTPKIWRCELSKTAGEAMSLLKEKASDIEVAANCYVVSGERLVGVVPLRELAIADPAATLETLMVKDVISVHEDAERGDAAEIISTHNFLSLPVTDHEGHLVGAVTVDDLLDSAIAKVGAGLLNQGGVAGKVAGAVPYFQTSLPRVVRSRITWLVLLFVAETATGTVLRHFEVELQKWVQLAFFIPLLIGTGGNAGSQTVSTVIRALALGEVRLRDVLRVVS
ncbi:magnesium transporter, partial [bacterium]|nr:magnesium transporter [bacterium]